MEMKRMKMEVIENGRSVPKDQQRAVLIAASDRFHARRLLARVERTRQRHSTSPERQSVAIACLAVEEKIVKALWTIARQPLGRIAPLVSDRCGIDYIHDRSDIHSIYADAAGGKWDSIAPRPALPGAKEITEADRVHDWLLLIDDEPMRKLLVVGATYKRGDAGRQINWNRVREKLQEMADLPSRTLKWRYQESLRIIVSELTLAKIA